MIRVQTVIHCPLSVPVKFHDVFYLSTPYSSVEYCTVFQNTVHYSNKETVPGYFRVDSVCGNTQVCVVAVKLELVFQSSKRNTHA